MTPITSTATAAQSAVDRRALKDRPRWQVLNGWGAELRRRRELAGLSLEQIADQLSVIAEAKGLVVPSINYGVIRRHEVGQHAPQIEMQALYAAFYGTTPEVLFRVPTVDELAAMSSSVA